MPTAARHLRALDGVRGLAILLVVLDHAAQVSPVPAPGVGKTLFDALLAGRMGVDLFFVLSGFLITGILLDARGDGPQTPAGYFSAFYARRALRILPAYCLLIATFQAPWWYWLFTQNVLVTRYGWGAAPLALNHLWSLAVEEQFYIVWPAIVAVLPRRALRALCLALILSAPILRLVLPPIAAYTLTIARADALAMGGLVAILVRDRRLYARHARVALAAGIAAVALLLSTDSLAKSFGPLSLVAGSSAVAVLAGAGIYLMVVTRAPRWLEHPILVSLGAYSYAMYLVHVPLRRPVSDWVGANLSGAGPILLANTIGLLGVAWAVAWISWHVLERPILSLKRFVPMPSPSPRDDRQRDVGQMTPIVQDALVGDH
jgi:peptidoglycan/LPS O-acetylase OafA/YrhL